MLSQTTNQTQGTHKDDECPSNNIGHYLLQSIFVRHITIREYDWEYLTFEKLALFEIEHKCLYCIEASGDTCFMFEPCILEYLVNMGQF